MPSREYPLMYGVWHAEDRTWVAFFTYLDQAHDYVTDVLGDHLEIDTVTVEAHRD